MPCRYPLRAQEWHPLGDAAPGDGLWQGHDLLAAAAAGLESRPGSANNPRDSLEPVAGGRRDRLSVGVADSGTVLVFGGQGTGSKHHVLFTQSLVQGREEDQLVKFYM